MKLTEDMLVYRLMERNLQDMAVVRDSMDVSPQFSHDYDDEGGSSAYDQAVRWLEDASMAAEEASKVPGLPRDVVRSLTQTAHSLELSFSFYEEAGSLSVVRKANVTVTS